VIWRGHTVSSWIQNFRLTKYSAPWISRVERKLKLPSHEIFVTMIFTGIHMSIIFKWSIILHRRKNAFEQGVRYDGDRPCGAQFKTTVSQNIRHHIFFRCMLMKTDIEGINYLTPAWKCIRSMGPMWRGQPLSSWIQNFRLTKYSAPWISGVERKLKLPSHEIFVTVFFKCIPMRTIFKW